jgi:hypothetical protein
MRYIARLAVILVLMMSASGAHALSCVRQLYDETEAKRMFGPAKMVFIGTLREVGESSRREGWHNSVEALFSVEQVFKGEPQAEQRVRINSGNTIGQRYVVYANDQKGELRADEACWPHALQIGEGIRGHLDFLNGLAAPGSGGDIALHALREPFSRPLAGAMLEFEGPRSVLQLRTGEDGAANAVAIPAGVYRLLSKAPPGYRYECSAKSCDEIEVHDRGFSSIALKLNPVATLGIDVRDSGGKRYDLRAEFNVYSASTGQLLGPFSPSVGYLYINDKPFAAVERIVPGEYVLSLVITETSFDGRLDVVKRRVEVFDNGAAGAEAARRVKVNPGENVYSFVLPDTLKPVRTLIALEGEMRDLNPLFLRLLISAGGKYTERANYYLYKPKGHPDEGAFWSLPGQSWQIGAFGFNADGGRHGVATVSPTQDSTVKVRFTKWP